MIKKIDGKVIAEKILGKIQIDLMAKPKPKLSIILVGKDEASKVYVGRKEVACKKVGIEVKVVELEEEIELTNLKNIFSDVVLKSDAVILQLPLPEKFKSITDELLALIPIDKDVDCLRSETLAASRDHKIKWLPPIVEAVDQIATAINFDLSNKRICLVGKGKVTGQPLQEIYTARKYKVVAVDSQTPNINQEIAQAEVVISATGVAHLINGLIIKDNALVVDAGFSRKDGKIVGDVDTDSLANKSVYLSPSPGGIGPITVACLLVNVLKCVNK